MSQEIERKWLVRLAPVDVLDGRDGVPIRQAYLTGVDDDPEVRLREAGGARQLTVKVGRGLARDEFEIGIADDTFDGLWAHTEGARIDKVRYEIPLDERTAEVDVYRGAVDGLITVEVEFPSTEAAAAFDPPGWFGRDVTDDARYANRRLARDGPPPPDGPP